VTKDEFALALLELMSSNSKTFCARLEEDLPEVWGALEAADHAVIGTELFTAQLWAISALLKRDTQVLDLLHDGYFLGYYNRGRTAEEKGSLANAAQSALRERYDAYYKAWALDSKASGGSMLGFEMAQYFFPKRKPVRSAFLTGWIQIHMLAFMASVGRFRQQFKVAES
jgi:hypothetical protein